MDKHNPQVVSYVNYNAYTFDDVFNMRDENFKMAFALERYLTGEVLDDQRYFKWFAQYYKSEGGERTKSEIPMHTCTEDDYSQFYTVNIASKKRLENLKNQKAFMCLDLEQVDVEFTGLRGNR